MMDAARDRTQADEVAVLLARCGQADGIAFRRLYEFQSALLYGAALRITRQPALAMDAVHDAMLQVWRNSAHFDPARGSARAWLLSLVRRHALGSVARIGREAIGGSIPEATDADPDPLDPLLAAAEGRTLRRHLHEVDPGCRRLVVLAFVDGMAYAELAAHVGEPLGAVKSSIRRTLLTLRTRLRGA